MHRFIFFILWLLVACLIVGAWFAWDFYQRIYHPNSAVDETYELFIPTESSMDDLIRILYEDEVLHDIQSFSWLAGHMKYTRVMPGKYLVHPGENNLEIIRRLRSGNQEPVRLVLHNKRTLMDVASLLGETFEQDSASFYLYMISEESLELVNQPAERMMCVFIPNTYFMHWNSSPEAVIRRMMLENDRFWDGDRRIRAELIGYTPEEVYIIASIVQAETNHGPEMPTIAGVYLNRLRRGWNLEADPTVVFAWGDFTITRVLRRHLEIDSPYNTYRNSGLPPGPIYMPSIRAIDAVLNAEQHDYMFFCAKPDFSGQHVFSRSLSGHLQNAAAYHRFLNSLGR